MKGGDGRDARTHLSPLICTCIFPRKGRVSALLHARSTEGRRTGGMEQIEAFKASSILFRAPVQVSRSRELHLLPGHFH